MLLAAAPLRAQPAQRRNAAPPDCPPPAGGFYGPGLRRTHYWRYQGQVAGQPAVLELYEPRPHSLNGSYYYVRHGERLPLQVWCYQPGVPLFMLEQVLDASGVYFRSSGYFRAAQARGRSCAAPRPTPTARARPALPLPKTTRAPSACNWCAAKCTARRPTTTRPGVGYVQYRRPGAADTAWHSLGPARRPRPPCRPTWPGS